MHLRTACAIVFLALAVNCHTHAAVVFWLTTDPANGGLGADDLNETIEVFPERAAEATIWSKLVAPTTDLTVFGLSVAAVESNPDSVLDLLGVSLLNPLLELTHVERTYRYQFVFDSTIDEFSPCDDCELFSQDDDLLEDFSGVSIGIGFPYFLHEDDEDPAYIRNGVGIGSEAASFENDPHHIDGNWRMGTIEFAANRDGTTTLELSEGGPASSPVAQSAPSFSYYDLTLDIVVLPDYNRDGHVNAADYTVWRQAICTDDCSAADLLADGNFDGMVTGADYDKWKAYFGKTTGPPAGSLLAVPEPGMATYLFLSFGIQAMRARRVRR